MEGQLRRSVRPVPAGSRMNLNKNVYLANLRDRNEVLFYRLLTEHIQEMLPIVYTPTIGTAIERFSHEFRRTRGRVPVRGRHPEASGGCAFATLGMGPEDVDLHRRDRLRGHPRHRRLGRRRDRDRHRQALPIYIGGGWHPSPPGDSGRARHGHRQPCACSTIRCTSATGTPGSRDQRYDDLIDAYVTAVSEAVPERDAALGGLRRQQRPAHPRPSTPTMSARSTTTCRAPRAVVLAAAFSAVRAGRHPAAGPAGRHSRRGHRGHRHRGHDGRRSDGPRRRCPSTEAQAPVLGRWSVPGLLIDDPAVEPAATSRSPYARTRQPKSRAGRART